MEKYHYQFVDGFNVIEEGVEEMRYIRIRGIELAIKYGKKISDRIYNKELNKWQDIGYSMPDETYHMMGGTYRLDKDGRNFWKADDNIEWFNFKTE